ncbi:MAG: serine protease [Bacteroidales bacterium]|nr:serine protease [Bacteroidales bacterium]
MTEKVHIAIAALMLVASDVTAQTSVEEIDWVTTESARYVYAESKGRDILFANSNKSDFCIDNSGVLEVKSDGTYRWMLGLRADWALNMSVDIKGLKMGEDDHITVTSPDGEQYQMYTSEDMTSDGRISTFPMAGDSIIVEVRGRDIAKADFKIDMVSVGFRSLPEHQQSHGRSLKSGYGSSGNCEVNVTCDDISEMTKQSVCRLIVKGSNGNSYGTGTLMNNTRQDGAPYILTAAHVLDGSFVGGTALFNFESPVCQNLSPTTSMTATLEIEKVLIRLETRDMMLLKLKKAPSSKHMPYWAGWDVTSNTVSGEVYCIHHPNADVKKISKAKSATPGATYDMDKTNSGESFDKASHWLIERWEAGATEGGSSGSALFNLENKVIGTLSGGSATCTRPVNDYYAMLSKSWDEMKVYLSPDNENIKKMDGAWLSDEKYGVVYSLDNEADMKCDRPADKKGYVAGYNNCGTTALAQRIAIGGSSTKVIQGMMIMPKVIGTKGNTFDIAIWECKDGEPGELLSRTKVANTMARESQTYVELTDKINVSSDVYAGIIFDSSYMTDTIALYHADGEWGRFQVGGEWKKATYMGLEKSQDIMIGLKYVEVKQSAIRELTAGRDIKMIKRSESDYEIKAMDLEKIDIFDIMGRKIASEESGNRESVVMDMSRYGGCVIVRVKTKEGYGSFKVMAK